MTCTDFDIRDFFLGELPESDRERTVRHLASCSGCAGELESLRHLRFALELLPDQEPPQRIGFVSDKVFEPARSRRMWNAFWNSAPRLGFASAAMLSVALVIFAFRPAPVAIVSRVPITAQTVAFSGVKLPDVKLPDVTLPDVTPLINETIREAVRKAVADTELRQQKRTDLLLAASERKHEQDQQAIMMRVADAYTMMQKRIMVSRASLVNYGGESQ